MSPIRFTLSLVVLTVVHLVAFVVAGTVFPIPLPAEATPVDPAGSMGPIAAVCLGHALVLAGLFRDSRTGDARALGAVFLLFWTTIAFMTQVEMFFFAPAGVPVASPAAVLAMQSLAAVLTVPAAWALFRARHRAEPVEAFAHPLPKVLVGAAIYPVVYLTFGYYVALRAPAVQAYYGIADPGSYGAQLAHIWAETPELLPFQLGRGVLWMLACWPMALMLRGPGWRRGLWVGAGFGLFMSLSLWIPNPLMPPDVARAHFLETLPSNFLFGWLATWIWTADPRSRNGGLP